MASRPLLRLFHGHDPPVPDLGELTTSELCIAQIKAHLAYRKSYTIQDEHGSLTSSGFRESVPTLAALAASRIVSTLRYDMDGVRVLLQNCPEKLLRGIMESPRLHYLAFRSLGQAAPSAGPSQDPEAESVRKASRAAVEDVDSWILRNEKFIRRLASSHQSSMLVSLEDAAVIWPECTIKDTDITIPRRMPPRETFTFFDQKRKREIKVQPSSAKFAEVFQRLTSGILDGLDWNNVVIAGGMVLNTLLCVSEDMDSRFVDSDIDIYIHGLKPDEANKKVQHIHDIWNKNLDPTKQRFLVKNAKTFNFMSSYPERRLQIVLKMVASAAEVLLNFDLDPCAICWNGKEVLMLPRAARALETGYTVFTMDLVHGHHLGDRRATQEVRILKYADRGFGVLIPASLLDTAELDFTKREEKTMTINISPYSQSSQPSQPPQPSQPSQPRPAPDIVRGKKAVKRVAFLGEDTAHRYYLGKTRMESPIRRISRDPYDDEDDGGDSFGSGRSWHGPYHQPGGSGRMIAVVDVSNMNGRVQHIAQPGGRRGIGSGLELLMRLAGLFKFESQGRLRIDRNSLASITYDDHEVYDDLPSYTWNDHFDSGRLATSIDDHNKLLFARLQGNIRTAIHPAIADGRVERWRGYLTRKVRRMTHSTEFDKISWHQLTIPVLVPEGLEEYIQNTMRNVCLDHNMTWSDEMSLLIHIRDKSKMNGPTNIPDVPQGAWNLRFWVIGSVTMWAKWDPRVDEIFEVLWTLFHIQNRPDDSFCITEPDNEESRWSALTASQFDRRIIPASSLVPKNEPTELGSWPDAREKELFHDWLTFMPTAVSRAYSYDFHHPTYREWNGIFQVPEEWYWDEEVDGGNDGGNWAEWKEPGDERTGAGARKGKAVEARGEGPVGDTDEEVTDVDDGEESDGRDGRDGEGEEWRDNEKKRKRVESFESR